MTRLRRRILALKEGIDPADVQAIREGRLPKDGKLAALSALAKTMIEKRGRLDDRDRLRQRSCAGGHRHRRRVHDYELYRKCHENAVRGGLPGARPEQLSRDFAPEVRHGGREVRCSPFLATHRHGQRHRHGHDIQGPAMGRPMTGFGYGFRATG